MATVVQGWLQSSKDGYGRPRTATAVVTMDGHRGRPHGWPQGRPHGWPQGRPHGWPQGRPHGWPRGRPHGWPHGRPRIGPRSSTDDPRPSTEEAAMYHGTSKWQRGPLPSGCLRSPLEVVYGWPTGRPRMAQPVRVPAVSQRELVGATAITAGEHCWRPGEAPLALQSPTCCAMTGADGRDSAGGLWRLHSCFSCRQGCRHPHWRRVRSGAPLPANPRLPCSSRLSSWKFFWLLLCMSNPSSFQLCRLRQVPAEGRGDSSVAVVGKVVHMPVVVSSVSTVQKPSRIPWIQQVLKPCFGRMPSEG